MVRIVHRAKYESAPRTMGKNKHFIPEPCRAGTTKMVRIVHQAKYESTSRTMEKNKHFIPDPYRVGTIGAKFSVVFILLRREVLGA